MDVGGKRLGPEMAKAVRDRLTSLRGMSIAEIEALPESETAQLQLLGEPVPITTYRARTPTGQTLVVVQACHDRWFGITTEIEAAGFVVSASGEQVDAAEELLWDYT